MTTAQSEQAALAAAEAELHDLGERAREAHRAWSALDQQMTRKADEIRELRKRIREADGDPS
jgi:predicted  nucleic acid-binding Zn-ribbon protein